jgi:hypothetical protein
MQETLGPQIRVGCLVVPLHLADAFTEMAQRGAYGPDHFLLSALTRFIDESKYAAHARAIRSAYAERVAIAAMQPAHVRRWSDHAAGRRLPSGDSAARGFGRALRLPARGPSRSARGARCHPSTAGRHRVAGLSSGSGWFRTGTWKRWRRLAELVERARLESRPLDLASWAVRSRVAATPSVRLAPAGKFQYPLPPLRTGGWAVESTALEMRHTGNCIEGSNPSLSARLWRKALNQQIFVWAASALK